MKRKMLLMLAALMVAACGRQATVRQVDVLPEPVFMVQKEGTFVLHNSPKVSVVNVGQNSATVKYIMKWLRQSHLRPKLVSASEVCDIELLLNDTLNTELGDEGYLLEVRPSGIRLSANTETGLFYGYQTLAQLLPADVAGPVYSSIGLPECTILDYPRFGWRGLQLNLGGNGLSMKELRRVVDVMGMYKLNRLCVEGGRWTEDTSRWGVDSLFAYGREEVEQLAGYAKDAGVALVWDTVPVTVEELRTGMEEARDGNEVVVAPVDYWALERYQADPRWQPEASEGVLTLARCYSFDPVPMGTNVHVAAHVAGGQCRMQTDCVSNGREVEYMLLPRLLAVSERLWSRREGVDWNRFRRKVEEHKNRLGHRGYSYCEGAFTPQFTVYRVDDETTNVSIGTEVPNTYIFYTTDMSTPTRNSAIYLGPVNLKRGTHIKILPVYKDIERDSVYEYVIK